MHTYVLVRTPCGGGRPPSARNALPKAKAAVDGGMTRHFVRGVTSIRRSDYSVSPYVLYIHIHTYVLVSGQWSLWRAGFVVCTYVHCTVSTPGRR